MARNDIRILLSFLAIILYKIKYILHGIILLKSEWKLNCIRIDKRRGLKGNSMVLPIDENTLGVGISTEDDYTKKINNKIIKEAIDNMEEPDKSIFILRYFYYEKVKDIATRLNLSPKKVENCLFRSKDKLKKLLIERGIIYE